MGREVYCHFSFRKPNDKHYGIFATAMYNGENSRCMLGAKTVALTLWEDQQHIKAIQSYANALEYIFQVQGKLLAKGVTDVILVTDNSNLHGWITDMPENHKYKKYMQRAVEPYRQGGSKQLNVSVGLHTVVEREKSHKFCKEELICNKRPVSILDKDYKGNKEHVLMVGETGMKTIGDILGEDKPDVEFK